MFSEQGLRGERGDLVNPGERDQVLEQQGGDAAVVHVIGHRERDLGRIPGAVRPGGRVVAAAADHLISRQRQQRRVAGSGPPADPPRLGLDRQSARG